MKAEFLPSKPRGAITAPPSKSMAHRLLVLAGLAPGESRVGNIDYSEDILATIDCLEALGARAVRERDAVVLSGGVKREDKLRVLPCRESGSTLRFFIPIAMALGGEYLFTGSLRLMERPVTSYEDLAKETGILFEKREDGLFLSGKLSPGAYTLRGDISSQFITGMLFAMTLLNEKSRLTVLPPVQSRPYIALTVRGLSLFGAPPEECAGERGELLYKAGGTPLRARDVTVEGDYSNAAFLMALGLQEKSVTVTGLDENSLQGDRVCIEAFSALEKGFCTLDLSQCPDLGPVLFAVAGLLHGGRFTGCARLRLKESDRVAAMQSELRKCGVCAEDEGDTVTVYKGTLHAPEEEIDGHNDHRVVMAMSVVLSVTGGVIRGAQAVSKSYPGFFEDIKSLGVLVKTGQ